MRVIAKPGEFRIHGAKPRRGETAAQLLVRVGDGFSPEAADFLRLQFLEPRLDYRHVCTPGLEPKVSLVDELALRGYDLTTFRLSVFMKGSAPPRARIQLLRQRPGVLHARWSWVEYDRSPDLVCAWAAPCSRRDSNLILAMLSRPNRRLSECIGNGGFGCTTVTILEKFGVEMPSFRLLVKMNAPVTSRHAAL